MTLVTETIDIFLFCFHIHTRYKSEYSYVKFNQFRINFYVEMQKNWVLFMKIFCTEILFIFDLATEKKIRIIAGFLLLVIVLLHFFTFFERSIQRY